MSYTLVISSGRGPVECAYGVGKLFKHITEEAWRNSLDFVVVEKIEAGYDNCYHSVTLNFDISAKDFCKKFEGTIQWICQSTFRPTHKRKNWFLNVVGFEFPEVDTFFNTKDLEITVYRAGMGNGGQHLNKTETSIRILHKPTGVVVEANEERSQYQNRKLALLKLAKIFQEKKQAQLAKNDKQKWDSHNQLIRGNPVMTFVGLEFKIEEN